MIREEIHYAGNPLCIENVRVEEIVKRYQTPLYVYSANAMLDPLDRLSKGLEGLRPLICFAVKSNSNIHILKLLGDAGAGMDLVSGGEFRRALQAGIKTEKIVFSGVGKTREEMDLGIQHSIHSFNVESVSELEKLSDRAKASGKRVNIALRFNPDVNPKTHPYISTGLKQNKFGLNRAEVLEIVREIDRFSGVSLQGISIHIGSQILKLSPFEDAFTKLKRLVHEIEKKTKSPLSFLDLGGGLGVRYRNERPPQIEEYTRLIQKHFGMRSDYRGRYRILLEPGRTLSANSGILVTRVLYRKSRKNKDFLVVDAGMNDLLRPALYGSYHEVVPLEAKFLKGTKKSTDIVGPVCESSDCFASGRKISKSLSEGDLIALLSAGAYGMSMASHYNTRTKPAEVLVQDNGYRLIRRREEFEDLIRAETELRGKK